MLISCILSLNYVSRPESNTTFQRRSPQINIMNEGWNTRNEILKASHQWPIILGFCLIGILLGWSVSWFMPAKYRSVKAIYVGINAYNAFADRNAAEHAGVKFNNPDDYKNWQMANLNALITSEGVFSLTLDALKAENNLWDSYTTEDLANILHAKWRNAGKWFLVAESDDSKLSTQAVLAWHDIVLVTVRSAISQAQTAYTIDIQIKSLSEEIAHLQATTASLEQTLTQFQNLQEEINNLNADAPTPPELTETINALATTLPQDASWSSIISSQPTENADAETTQNWVNQVITALTLNISNYQAQIDILNEELQSLSAAYAEASNKSYGLSPNLQVEKISSFTPKETMLRPTGFLVLIGGILGFFAWLLLWFGKFALRDTQ